MRVASPLTFYPWRMADATLTVVRWLSLVRRYRAILKRVVQDESNATYRDHALTPVDLAAGEQDDLVVAYADQLTKTHGAPVMAAP